MDTSPEVPVFYTYPEFRKLILGKIKEEQIYQKSVRQRTIDARQTHPFKLSEGAEGWNEACIEGSEKRIAKLQVFIKRMDFNKADTRGLDFDRAKLVPISNFVDFKGGVARCVWHNEKTPSMKYYKDQNKVWCFGCNRGGDVIDVVMAQQNLSIKQATAIVLS